MNFILTFQVFFRIYFIIEIEKGVYYSYGTRGVDMAQGGHVVEPREPTWMPMWMHPWTHGCWADS